MPKFGMDVWHRYVVSHISQWSFEHMECAELQPACVVHCSVSCIFAVVPTDANFLSSPPSV